MEVTVDVPGNTTRSLDLPEDATVADLVATLPVSIHEVALVADGRTLPADAPIPPNAESLHVVRLVEGG